MLKMKTVKWFVIKKWFDSPSHTNGIGDACKPFIADEKSNYHWERFNLSHKKLAPNLDRISLRYILIFFFNNTKSDSEVFYTNGKCSCLSFSFTLMLNSMKIFSSFSYVWDDIKVFGVLKWHNFPYDPSLDVSWSFDDVFTLLQSGLDEMFAEFHEPQNPSAKIYHVWEDDIQSLFFFFAFRSFFLFVF
jgi:hypothetical protein